jgi:hypothetical protein
MANSVSFVTDAIIYDVRVHARLYGACQIMRRFVSLFPNSIRENSVGSLFLNNLFMDGLIIEWPPVCIPSVGGMIGRIVLHSHRGWGSCAEAAAQSVVQLFRQYCQVCYRFIYTWFHGNLLVSLLGRGIMLPKNNSPNLPNNLPKITTGVCDSVKPS